MPDNYIPPFTMTEEITNLVIEIAELTGAMTVSEQLSKNPKLRRDNRIKSIHSSLAIEQNTLTEEQVSDVIDGKRVLGPPQDIREVQNAYEAYEIMTKLNPYSVKDLLKAHKIMMDDLVKEAGVFRSKGVGVYAGDQLIHAGTPANYVPDLVGQLFDWLKENGNQSAAGLAEIVGSSQRTVQRALKRLMDEGKIEHVGSNRFGHYVIK